MSVGRWDQNEKAVSVLWPGKGLLPLSLLFNLTLGQGQGEGREQIHLHYG